MTKELKLAVIADAQGTSDGDHGYTLYYVAGDPDGRWILTDNAGVICTNYNFTDVYRNQGDELDAEGDRLEVEISAIIDADAGEVSSYYTGDGTHGHAGSEAEDLMVEWGWLQPQVRVAYQAGPSRQHAGKGVDWMMATVPQADEPGGIELYAEAVNPTWDEDSESYTDETATYEDLRVEILRQAVEHGIDVTTLEFAYDGDEAGRLLAVRQAADILGISEIRVRQLCQDGRMGRKVGDTWVITPEDIERNRVRLPGRPRSRQDS